MRTCHTTSRGASMVIDADGANTPLEANGGSDMRASHYISTPSFAITAMSALASQLAASTSLNASLLQDRSKKRHTESYLFTGRDADLHDLDAVHAIAASAFTQLRALSPALSSESVRVGPDGSPRAVDFEHALFSDAARALDRTLQTPDLNADLDHNINAFLPLLGPWLMDSPTTKVLEWLVRRFR